MAATRSRDPSLSILVPPTVFDSYNNSSVSCGGFMEEIMTPNYKTTLAASPLSANQIVSDAYRYQMQHFLMHTDTVPKGTLSSYNSFSSPTRKASTLSKLKSVDRHTEIMESSGMLISQNFFFKQPIYLDIVTLQLLSLIH